MFATPNTAGRSGATRRLPFSTSGTASRRRSNLFDDEEPGAESPVPPTTEAEPAAGTSENREILSILRSLQQQVTALQAKSQEPSAVSPSASTSSSPNTPTSRKLPKGLTVSLDQTMQSS